MNSRNTLAFSRHSKVEYPLFGSWKMVHVSNLVHVQRMYQKEKWDKCVYKEIYVLFKNVLAVPYCFIDKIYLQQNFVILYSPWCNNSCRAYHKLRQGYFYPFDHDQEKFPFVSNYLPPTKEKNLTQGKLC